MHDGGQLTIFVLISGEVREYQTLHKARKWLSFYQILAWIKGGCPLYFYVLQSPSCPALGKLHVSNQDWYCNAPQAF
jgi:hypothetical protein